MKLESKLSGKDNFRVYIYIKYNFWMYEPRNDKLKYIIRYHDRYNKNSNWNPLPEDPYIH